MRITAEETPPRYKILYQGMASAVPNQFLGEGGFSRCTMAIPTRHSDPGGISANSRTFFVTSSTWGKRSLLQSQRTASLFIDLLYEYRRLGKFRLHEFVVMPDHFHVLITVDRESSIERAVQFIKGGFAYRSGKQLGLRAPVWQKGFSEVRVLTPVQFARIQDYIRENPTARHLVERGADFAYSSAHAGFELDPPPQGLKPSVEAAAAGMPEGMP